VSHEAEIAAAEKEARQARRMSMVWWAQVPLVTIVYWLISHEPLSEKLILVYLADVSIIANAVSYSGKAKAAEAKKAGYENPRED
jgi:hypothetical protein